MSVINKTNKVTLDEVLLKFSLSGYYARFILLIFFMNVFSSMSINNYVFSAQKSTYRCLDSRFGNDSCADLTNSSEKCTEWEYDDPQSFVAEFQLACQEWKRTLVGSAHNFGYGVGLVIIGPLSDRYGRKIMIVITAVVGALAGILKSIVTNYWLFVTIEFIEAAFGDFFSPAFILTMEMVAYDKRVLTKTLCSLGSVLAHVILPLTAWYVEYWRNMLQILYAPSILFCSYIYLLDESPRWLLCKGRKEEAIAILENIAKKSKVKVDKDLYENLSYDENKGANLKESLKETFASRILLIRFFICIIWWTAASFVSYGISINSVLLPGNKYINYGLISVADIPARLLTFWLLTRFRRKIPLICSFFVAAAFCFAQTFTPNNLQWLSILLLLSAKTVTSMFFSIVYIFTSELFPTHTRNSMHATCSALGRVGSTLAPQTPLLITYWSGFPSLVFGLAALMAGLSTLFAPDMTDPALPDTVQQAVGIGQKQPSSK